jgi:hypothetical protein
MIVMMVAPLIRHSVIVVIVGTRLVHLRLLCQGDAYRGQALKNLRIMMALHCYTTNSFAKKNGDGDADSLLSLMPFLPPTISFIFVMSL